MDVKSSNTPTILSLSRNFSEVEAKLLVTKEITGIIKFLNLGKNMNAEQVLETVELIFINFPNVQIADLKLFSSRFKAGYYGKAYDRLDGQTILLALNKYVEEKMQWNEEMNLREHENRNKDSGKIDSRIIEVMKKVLESSKPKFEEPKEVKPSKPKNTDEYQRIYMQFINLMKKYQLKPGISILKINGLILDWEKFYYRKLNNYKNLQNGFSSKS